MKKFHQLLLTASAVILFSTMSFGQMTVFFDNFDSYTAGDMLACQNPTDWTTWSLSPCLSGEDAVVSNAYSSSSPNSVVIVQNNDLVKPLGDMTTGYWNILFDVYIPQGKSGYFNTLASFTGGVYEWGVEVYFDAGGGGRVSATGADFPFSWPEGAWFPVIVEVNLNTDLASVWVNGTQVVQWQWTIGASGTGVGLMLAANDFYGAEATDEMYFDNYTLMDMLNVPVELTSFTAVQQGSEVKLEWTTATEINNQGFEIQRKINDASWQTLAFKEGMGTHSNPVTYTYLDNISGIQADQIGYRLKQIDYDGRYEFSDVVVLESITPLEFALHQNYPNPFNPSTQIQYDLPEANFVNISVYNTLGEEVAVLTNELKEAGSYIVNFDASSLSAGVYIYTIQAGNYNSVKKMMLIK